MPRENMPHKCSICNERDAVIFVKIVTEDSIEEKGLCATCAARYLEKKNDITEVNVIDERLIQVIEEMKDLLAGIVANISAISVIMNSQKGETGVRCSNCGTTFQEVKTNGYLGCPYCYSSFRTHIQDYVFETQRGSAHKGRMPEKFAKLYILKKEISFLNNKLKRLLENEQYEEADKIRKKLDRLTGNHDIERQDETN